MPVQYVDAYDGEEWIEKAAELGWTVPGLWGRDGWNLGRFPYVIIAVYANKEAQVWAAVTYVEGDTEVYAYSTRDEWDRKVTEIAAWYWRHYQNGPDDLPDEGNDFLPHHMGPFSWERLDRENPLTF